MKIRTMSAIGLAVKPPVAEAAGRSNGAEDVGEDVGENAYVGTLSPTRDDPDGAGANSAEAAASAVGDGDAPTEPVTSSSPPGTTRTGRAGASVTAAEANAPRDPAITEPAEPRGAAVESARRDPADFTSRPPRAGPAFSPSDDAALLSLSAWAGAALTVSMPPTPSANAPAPNHAYGCSRPVRARCRPSRRCPAECDVPTELMGGGILARRRESLSSPRGR